jgi:predicted amidohydrolase/ribosomal protein S18 acetylase RimI-like enzyme
MTELDLSKFDREIAVRPLLIEDYEKLIELQALCFPGMPTWSRAQIESQLSRFPEGQICIDYGGRLVASSSSLIIDFDEYDDAHSWSEISAQGYITNHDREGDSLYGIEIMVHPEFRGMKLARRLYDARKQLVVDSNLKRIILGGRIPGYARHASEMSARRYVQAVIDRKIFDQVLSPQLNNGFILKRLLESYLTDKQSKDYATLLEWTNLDYAPTPGRRHVSSRLVRICCVQYQVRPIKSFEEFARQAEYFADVAGGYKSDFVLFPEIFTLQLLSFIEARTPADAVRRLAEYTPRYIEHFSNLALKYNVNIVGGSHFTVENDDLYNVAYLFHRNGGVDKQYKLHITKSERDWWGVKPGHGVEVFETDVAKVNIQICYDVEFPELTRIASSKGAMLIFVPFSTDERHGYLRVRYCAQARCIENPVYVAIAGTVGNLPQVKNMDIQYAQSGIFTPSDFQFSRDAVGAECTPNIETVVVHDVDLEVMRRHRLSGTTTNWLDRRADLYDVGAPG